jgi:hypothetical protein
MQDRPNEISQPSSQKPVKRKRDEGGDEGNRRKKKHAKKSVHRKELKNKIAELEHKLALKKTKIKKILAISDGVERAREEDKKIIEDKELQLRLKQQIIDSRNAEIKTLESTIKQNAGVLKDKEVEGKAAEVKIKNITQNFWDSHYGALSVIYQNAHARFQDGKRIEELEAQQVADQAIIQQLRDRLDYIDLTGFGDDRRIVTVAANQNSFWKKQEGDSPTEKSTSAISKREEQPSSNFRL